MVILLVISQAGSMAAFIVVTCEIQVVCMYDLNHHILIIQFLSISSFMFFRSFFSSARSPSKIASFL